MMATNGAYCVYILENRAGRFYLGSTNDIARRVVEHNSPDEMGRRFTSKHGPWSLVWWECHPSRSAAMRREQQIKQMKSARWIRRGLLGREEGQW